MVLALGASSGHRRRAVELFQRWHPGTRPSSMTIVRAYETLRQTGTFTKKRHKSSILGEDVETDILSKFSSDPHASVRSVGAEAGVSKSSVWRVLKKRQLHPYHVQLHQMLEPRDFQNRKDFANWIIIKTEEDPGFVNKILWTDEATFSRNAQVNIHNAHYWSDENPHWVLKTHHQYQWSVNVWCGIHGGPVFLITRLQAKDTSTTSLMVRLRVFIAKFHWLGSRIFGISMMVLPRTAAAKLANGCMKYSRSSGLDGMGPLLGRHGRQI